MIKSIEVEINNKRIVMIPFSHCDMNVICRLIGSEIGITLWNDYNAPDPHKQSPDEYHIHIVYRKM